LIEHSTSTLDNSPFFSLLSHFGHKTPVLASNMQMGNLN
jgi:hypothetical protein